MTRACAAPAPRMPLPASTRPLTPIERLLRLAAHLLPTGTSSPKTSSLNRISHDLRSIRAYYAHDPETMANIDAWLEVYGEAR